MNVTKKEKVIIILYLITIFFIGIGISYSYYLLASTEDDSSRIYAGKLEIYYNQGSDVSTDVLYPISEPSFNTLINVYRTNFTVQSNGTLEQNVSINFNTTYTEFASNQIKYALYTSSGVKLATGYLNQGVVTLVNRLYFKPIDSKEYVLIIWLDDNGSEQIQESNHRLAGNIIVTSKQYGF